MAVPVIVPLHSKLLFKEQVGIEVEPIFYHLYTEPVLHKIRRKLNLIDPNDVLAQRLEFTASADRVREARALWLTPVTFLPPAQMDCFLDLLPGLKWVYSQMTGTEHLDLNSFRKRNVMVSNVGDMSSRRVAEMALACIFSHTKRLPEHIAMQRRRKWESLVCSDIKRQKVGIIGTGNIGNELARLCAAVGMRVIGASRDPARILAVHKCYSKIVNLDAELEILLQQADHVVLALPLTPRTKGLLGCEQIKQMRENASLVNVGRGAVIDEASLCRALSRGIIGAAYIDVPAKVPLPRWSRMYRTPNLVLTHYSSANSPDVIADAFAQFITGLKKLKEGSQPANRVL